MLSLADKWWKHREMISKYKSCYFWSLTGMPWLRNNLTNKAISSLLLECIESGVDSVEKDRHYCTVSFSNGYKFNLWIANKMYAYGTGSYTTPDGEYRRFSGMPSRFVNNVFREYVENWK